MLKSIFLLFAFPLLVFSQSQLSNDEISKKLDLILQKVSDLEQRVVKLESASIKVQKEVQSVAKSAEEVIVATKSLAIPQSEEEKRSFFNQLRIGIESDEAKSKGAWTKKETWNSMKKNLTRFQVRKLLGNPNTIQNNLNPRIDQTYYYYGDIDSDGKKEEAHIHFFRDRVVSYNSPI